MEDSKFSALDRRALFAGSVAAATLAAAPSALAASDTRNFAPRGMIGRHERLAQLDLESQQDMLEGIRIWVNGGAMPGSRAAQQAPGNSEARLRTLLKERGINPDSEAPIEDILKAVDGDPIVTFHPMAWLRVQQLMWTTLQTHFHSHADAYLSEMERADRTGLGSLELNPKMKIPAYAAREIHMQPGGYVGDPFAGHIYHRGTNQFLNGNNYQDETHDRQASLVLVPENRKVRRVLEMGTGIGQLPMALKRRFPDAEVWGIDVGGPMVRYAHMRANDLGLNVNFAQRLAEETDFPDNYFDVITSMQFFHEVRADETKKILREAYRILRPGGVLYALDGNPATRSRSTVNRFRAWWIYRWNHEDWAWDWTNFDYPGELRKAGFKLDPTTGAGGSNVLAIKA